MAVIDLDLLAPGEPEPDPPARRPRRRLAALIVLCGVLFAGAADARAKSWAQDVTQFHVESGSWLVAAGDDLLVATSGEVIAYDFVSGRQRWRAATALSGGEVLPYGRLLVVTGADPSGLDSGTFRPRAVAIDQASGEILWRVSGSVQVEGELLVLYGETVLSLLREDGTKVWTLDGQGITPVIDEHATLVATLDKLTGELVERSLPTLIELRRVILPGAAGADGIWFYDGTLNVYTADGPGLQYDSATLAPLPPDPVQAYRVDCGRVWCMINENTLVDKKTGVTLHDIKNWQYAISSEAGVLGLGFLIGDGEPTAVKELYDPRTGKVIDLEGWAALNLGAGTPVLASGRSILLALRGKTTSYLAAFDDHGISRLGVLPASDIRQCVLAGAHLACRIGPESVRVWRLA